MFKDIYTLQHMRGHLSLPRWLLLDRALQLGHCKRSQIPGLSLHMWHHRTWRILGLFKQRSMWELVVSLLFSENSRNIGSFLLTIHVTISIIYWIYSFVSLPLPCIDFYHLLICFVYFPLPLWSHVLYLSNRKGTLNSPCLLRWYTHNKAVASTLQVHLIKIMSTMKILENFDWALFERGGTSSMIWFFLATKCHTHLIHQEFAHL